MISVCPVVTWLRSINAYTCSSSYTFADGNSPSMILQKRQSSCLISQQLLHKMYCTYQFIIKMKTSILKVLLIIYKGLPRYIFINKDSRYIINMDKRQFLRRALLEKMAAIFEQ